MNFLKTGKLPPYLMDRLFQKNRIQDSRVILGPQVGEDATVIEMGDRYLIAKTDPITFTEERIGWYCVNINANDVACMGAKPLWFLATLLLPENRTDQNMVERIFDDILTTCRQLNITLCGGHTEITVGLNRPILIGQMLGEVSKDKIVLSSRIQAGDHVLITQGAAIEGTAILAYDKIAILSEKIDPEIIKRAKGFLTKPGISVVEAALTACMSGEIHGMHDPTEGGIIAGLWELGTASGLGLRIQGEAIPIFPETQAICDALELNPLMLIASGALLIVVPESSVSQVIQALSEKKIPCHTIGVMVPSAEEMSIRQRNQSFPIEPIYKDELTKIFS
jgi:hydrogenase maturation factor